MFSRKGLGRIGLLNPPATRGGAALLRGESGLGIDFSDSSGVGSVSVIGHTTNYNNIPVDSFLTNSGTSPKLVRNAAGTYVFSAHNLTYPSNDPSGWTNSNVTFAAGVSDPDGGTSATTITATGANGAAYRQFSGGITGASYTGAIWIKRRTGTGNIDVINAAGGRISVAVTSTWQQFTNTSTAVSANPFWGVEIDTSGNAIDVWRAQINRGTTPTTYLATTTAAKYAVPTEYDAGWYALVEPAATNLALQSQAFGTTWANTNTDEPTTNNTAPDGSATADEIAATSAANQAFAIYQGFTGLTAGNTATCSVFLKAGTNATMAQLAWDANGTGADGCFCNFNLSTGAKGTVTALAAGTATSSVITSVGNGWYRCSITGKIAVGTAGRFTISIVDLITEAVFGAANLADNDSIVAWQGQVEAAASSVSLVATSPIPTFAASVTRAADNVNVATSAFPFSATAGTIIWEGSDSLLNNTSLWSLGDGTNNERIVPYTSSGNTIGFLVSDGGGTQANITGFAASPGVNFKSGGAWAANDFAFVKDGGTVGTDVSGTLPTVTTLRLHDNSLAGASILGRVKNVVYLPRRMTNAELQARTT